MPWVRDADVLFADGGDATYLSAIGYGVRSRRPPAIVGRQRCGSGSARAAWWWTPRIGDYFVEWLAAPDDRGLGMVEFSIFPHLDAFPTNTPADAERWAASLDGPSYAIDESTAIRVVDGAVDVISEGRWLAFNRSCQLSLTRPGVADRGVLGSTYDLPMSSIFSATAHVFVDESKAQARAISSLPPTLLPNVFPGLDRDLRRLTRRGQSRIHFGSERRHVEKTPCCPDV